MTRLTNEWLVRLPFNLSNLEIQTFVVCWLACLYEVSGQRPGYPPTEAPEEEEVDDIGPFKE